MKTHWNKIGFTESQIIVTQGETKAVIPPMEVLMVEHVGSAVPDGVRIEEDATLQITTANNEYHVTLPHKRCLTAFKTLMSGCRNAAALTYQDELLFPTRAIEKGDTALPERVAQHLKPTGKSKMGKGMMIGIALIILGAGAGLTMAFLFMREGWDAAPRVYRRVVALCGVAVLAGFLAIGQAIVARIKTGRMVSKIRQLTLDDLQALETSTDFARHKYMKTRRLPDDPLPNPLKAALGVSFLLFWAPFVGMVLSIYVLGQVHHSKRWRMLGMLSCILSSTITIIAIIVWMVKGTPLYWKYLN